MKLNHQKHLYRTGQSGITVTLSTLEQLKSLKENTIREVLKGYGPPSRTNLADLAINKRNSQHDIVLS